MTDIQTAIAALTYAMAEFDKAPRVAYTEHDGHDRIMRDVCHAQALRAVMYGLSEMGIGGHWAGADMPDNWEKHCAEAGLVSDAGGR
jgi:hypothetical protein